MRTAPKRGLHTARSLDGLLPGYSIRIPRWSTASARPRRRLHPPLKQAAERGDEAGYAAAVAELTGARPNAFCSTSGSSGGCKYIPTPDFLLMEAVQAGAGCLGVAVVMVIG